MSDKVGLGFGMTIFNPHDGFNSRDPLSSYIFYFVFPPERP